jgi:hypothetical protein
VVGSVQTGLKCPDLLDEVVAQVGGGGISRVAARTNLSLASRLSKQALANLSVAGGASQLTASVEGDVGSG